MDINSVSVSPEMECHASFLKLVIEMPCGVFHQFKNKYVIHRDSRTGNLSYRDIERTFLAVQYGNSKVIYDAGCAYSHNGMGFDDCTLSLIAIVVNNTVYVVDEYGFRTGIVFGRKKETLDTLSAASHACIRFFSDYREEIQQAITINLENAYETLSVEGILSEAEKKGIDATLRCYTAADPECDDLDQLLNYHYELPDALTITSILCGVQDQAEVEAMILSHENVAMIRHKAIREYTVAKMEEAFKNPDRVLRIAMGLNKAPSTAKNVHITFSVDDAEETLKLPVWRLRALLRGNQRSLSYWDFDSGKKAKAAMERFGVDDLYPCDIDKVVFNGKILYANDEE